MHSGELAGTFAAPTITFELTSMITARLAERDEYLVNLLRRDKAAFLREYRRVLAIPESEPLSGLLDREMICAILDHEFPEVRLPAKCEPK